MILLAIIVAIVIYASQPSNNVRADKGADLDALREIVRVAIARSVAWAAVSIAMVVGLVAWAVWR